MTTQTDAAPFKAQALRGSSPSAVTTNVPTRSFSFESTRRNVQTAFDDTPPKKFVERKHFKLGNFEYERNGDEPGLIVIFNQETFLDKDYEPRKGSRRDVNEITTCFQRQGFNVDIQNIFTDFTSIEVREKLKELADIDFTTYNCLIVFFLTHGETFNGLHTKDGIIMANDIWNEFKRNRSLQNKPKMFIFQACKGEGFSTTGHARSPTSIDNSAMKPPELTKLVPSRTLSDNFLYPDLLIVYSTLEGNYSFRNSLTGSWFIQELCKNVSAYGKRDDVISLIIRTTKCVAGNYYHNKDNFDRKQMPMFVSTLRKKFFLNRNKDRDILIRIADSNEEILRTMKEIKSQLDGILLKDEDKKKKK